MKMKGKKTPDSAKKHRWATFIFLAEEQFQTRNLNGLISPTGSVCSVLFNCATCSTKATGLHMEATSSAQRRSKVIVALTNKSVHAFKNGGKKTTKMICGRVVH